MRFAKFLSYVPEHLGADVCWPWQGETAERYPGAPLRARYAGQWATRIIYTLRVGPIPPRYEIDHLCTNTLCVNPEHLEAVTRAENMRRVSARQTHCKNGHEFTEANTYRHKVGTRTLKTCRACNAANQRRRQRRLKEQTP